MPWSACRCGCASGSLPVQGFAPPSARARARGWLLARGAGRRLIARRSRHCIGAMFAAMHLLLYVLVLLSFLEHYQHHQCILVLLGFLGHWWYW